MLTVYLGRSLQWVSKSKKIIEDWEKYFDRNYKKMELDPWIKAKVQELDTVELTDRYTYKDGDGVEKSIIELSDIAKLCLCLYAFPNKIFCIDYENRSLTELVLILTVPVGSIYMGTWPDIFCEFGRTRNEPPIYDKCYEIPASVRMISEYQIQCCETVQQAFLFFCWYHRRETARYTFSRNDFLKEHAVKRVKGKGMEYMTYMEFLNLYSKTFGRIFRKECSTCPPVFNRELELADCRKSEEERQEWRYKKSGGITVNEKAVKKKYEKEVTRKQRAKMGFSNEKLDTFPSQRKVVNKISKLHWLPRLRSAKLGLIGAYATGTQNNFSVIEVAYWPTEEGFPLVEREYGRKLKLKEELEAAFHKEVVIHDYRELKQELRRLNRPLRGLRFKRRDLTEQERQEEIVKRERIVKAIENDALWIDLSKKAPKPEPVYPSESMNRLGYEKGGSGDLDSCIIRLMYNLKKDKGVDELESMAVINETMPYLMDGTTIFGKISETSQNRIKRRVLYAVKEKLTALCQLEIRDTLDGAGTREAKELVKDMLVVKALAFDLNRIKKLLDGDSYESDFEFALWLEDLDLGSPNNIIELALALDKMELKELDSYKVVGIGLVEDSRWRGSRIMIKLEGFIRYERSEESGHIDMPTRDYDSINEIVSYSKETGIVTFKATTYTGEEVEGQADIGKILRDSFMGYHMVIPRCIETVEIIPKEFMAWFGVSDGENED